MSVTLTICVTPQSAALAGVDRSGDIVVPLTPSTLSEAARKVLAKLLERAPCSSSVNAADMGAGSYVDLGNPPAEATPEAVSAWIEAGAMKIAAARAAKIGAFEADIQRAISAPDETWISYTGQRFFLVDGFDKFSELSGFKKHEPIVAKYPVGQYVSDDRQADPRFIARRADVQASQALKTARDAWQIQFDAWTEFCNAKKSEAKAARKAVEEKEARKAAQLHAFMATAPESLRKRAARGLLPEDDIIAAMRNQAFSALDGLERYKRLSDADVRKELDAADYDEEVKYSTSEAESATDAEVDLMEKIENLIPGASTQLLDHIGYLASATDADDPEVLRRSVKVTLTVGEFVFTREFACPQ